MIIYNNIFLVVTILKIFSVTKTNKIYLYKSCYELLHQVASSRRHSLASIVLCTYWFEILQSARLRTNYIAEILQRDSLGLVNTFYKLGISALNI